MDGAKPQDLSVRQHERLACDLSARVAVVAEGVVRLSRLAPGGGGEFDARIVDLSRGGVGLYSPVYLPPASTLTVRLAGGPGLPELECKGVVRRAVMVERAPTYYLGVSVDTRTPETAASLERAMDAVRTATKTDAAAPDRERRSA